jgi:hypothetical protein
VTNTEVRDAFASFFYALEAGTITYKDAAQRNVALNGIIASARLELEALKTLKKPDSAFWIEGPMDNEKLGARVRSIAKEG